MRRLFRLAAPAVLLWAAGCAIQPQGVTDDALRNLTYRGIANHSVTLKDGLFEGAPFVSGGAARPRVELAAEPQVAGDLDGDGAEDRAVLLVETAGGAGENTYLALVSSRAGRVENVATRLIGDRVQIRSLMIRDGALVLELVTTGPGEPACCPTLKVRKTYRLQTHSLIEVTSEALGPIRVKDLEGMTWTLMRLARKEAVPEGIRITALFQDGRVSGSAGCNGYFAGISGDGPRDLSLGQAGATMMACPADVMKIEGRYLRALERVKAFSFLLGRLALLYQDGGITDALLFTPSR
jgi:heat shock protein HslJ